MKNAKKILSHLKHQPQFSKLAQVECIKKIQTLFPPHLQKMILFGYIRNHIVYFVLAHPGAKQEFDIILDSIKAPLRAYPPQECQSSEIQEIKAFVSHKPPRRSLSEQVTELPYVERSSGEFDNPTHDKKLHAIIEEIRAIIHARTD